MVSDLCEKICFEVYKVLQNYVGSMVEWLKRRDCGRHGLGSKSILAILLSPWETHFTTFSSAWRSWQAILNYSHISMKLKNK